MQQTHRFRPRSNMAFVFPVPLNAIRGMHTLVLWFASIIFSISFNAAEGCSSLSRSPRNRRRSGFLGSLGAHGTLGCTSSGLEGLNCRWTKCSMSGSVTPDSSLIAWIAWRYPGSRFTPDLFHNSATHQLLNFLLNKSTTEVWCGTVCVLLCCSRSYKCSLDGILNKISVRSKRNPHFSFWEIC